MLLPAVLLPLLGITAAWSMNAVADLGTDFFHAGALEHAVSYFSLENLKGAVISVSIGAAVYFVVVRKWLMCDGVYVDRWPKKLDLEELVYRPLLLNWLPAVFGWFAALFGENRLTSKLCRGLMHAGKVIGRLFGENLITARLSRWLMRCLSVLSHALCDSLDAAVYLLRKTVYRDSPPPIEDKVQRRAAYRLGAKVDAIAVRQGKAQPGEAKYARKFYLIRNTLKTTTRRITGNLSFALIMMCFAACVLFLFVLLSQG